MSMPTLTDNQLADALDELADAGDYRHELDLHEAASRLRKSGSPVGGREQLQDLVAQVDGACDLVKETFWNIYDRDPRHSQAAWDVGCTRTMCEGFRTQARILAALTPQADAPQAQKSAAEEALLVEAMRFARMDAKDALRPQIEDLARKVLVERASAPASLPVSQPDLVGSELTAGGGSSETSARFRKKPVEIEARQINIADYDAATAIVGWCGGRALGEGDEPHVLAIPTLEGEMRAEDGDWIIRGVKGEFYPCKPDIFAATYSRVEEGDAHRIGAEESSPKSCGPTVGAGAIEWAKSEYRHACGVVNINEQMGANMPAWVEKRDSLREILHALEQQRQPPQNHEHNSNC